MRHKNSISLTDRKGNIHKHIYKNGPIIPSFNDEPDNPMTSKQLFKVGDTVLVKNNGKKGEIDRIDEDEYYINDKDGMPLAVVLESDLIYIKASGGSTKIKKTRKSKRRGSKKGRITKRRR
jgi:hypothetical protein